MAKGSLSQIKQAVQKSKNEIKKENEAKKKMASETQETRYKRVTSGNNNIPKVQLTKKEKMRDRNSKASRKALNNAMKEIDR